ncbi:hypothetical protein MED222_05110 [Vibrio sp. MED222]|nr:hypothetical protein MED222_05110 [Vibrio sp. MED222]
MPLIWRRHSLKHKSPMASSNLSLSISLQ